ncbi:hypothetical protein AB0M86_42410 [Streptomyces sp. NPDC051639]|uniref:hypothetical protein n=1 Tax=Streptomyces sp. NPDC051639 TaxID=3155671 RepID=UPI003436EA7E
MTFPRRLRTGLSLAGGAAGATDPPAAAAAFAATPPSGTGWVEVGREHVPGGAQCCIDQMSAWVRQLPQYDEAVCVNDSRPGVPPDFYTVWMHAAE